MARNLARTTTQLLRGGLATEDQAKARTRICRHCEHYDKPSGRCKLCGCFVEAKAKVKHAKCPDNRWPSSEHVARKNNLSSK